MRRVFSEPTTKYTTLLEQCVLKSNSDNDAVEWIAHSWAEIFRGFQGGKSLQSFKQDKLAPSNTRVIVSVTEAYEYKTGVWFLNKNNR